MKQSVLGVRISTVAYAEEVARCEQWIEEARESKFHEHAAAGHYVCVTSVHGIMTARTDSAFRNILNNADIATPDGMPVVWALRSFGHRGQRRVYGPTLMLQICQNASERGHKVFLYGGRPESLEDLRRNLVGRFPALQISGAFSPPFRPLTPEEDAEVVRTIRDSGADLVFVGISTPKQENWMWAHKSKLPGVVMIGVGAAFDFHAGRVRQAPVWLQKHGLEWFYRLMMEPQRLWRRYLLQTPLFLPLWALQLTGVLSEPLESVLNDPNGERT
jgi:N-acetylglucosaminyldiphosphoundecaprenol N-acetyl-beta-D-mannosaminyltransferase